mgnify:CR=1 FL=1
MRGGVEGFLQAPVHKSGNIHRHKQKKGVSCETPFPLILFNA